MEWISVSDERADWRQLHLDDSSSYMEPRYSPKVPWPSPTVSWAVERRYSLGTLRGMLVPPGYKKCPAPVGAGLSCKRLVGYFLSYK